MVQENTLHELKSHKHIIFAFDHYNTLGALRSLGEAGLHAIVILYGKQTFLVKRSSYITVLHSVETVEEGYKLLLEKYGNEPTKPFLYSCDDFVESFLDGHSLELKDKFYFFCSGQSKNGVVSHYMDKEIISQLAVKCGAKVPRTEKLKRGQLPTTLKYPVITKSLISIKGGWKSDVFICNNEEELKEAYKKIKSEYLLIEEFIQKKNELCLDGFCVNNGEDVCIPYRTTYIRVAPGKYGNYMTLEPFNDQVIFQQVRKMLMEVGFSGVFSVEYLIDQNDELYFLEINFRNSTWSYAFTYGGVNLLLEWSRATLSGVIDISSSVLRKRPFTAMVEINDFADFVMKRKISFWSWIRDLYSCDCLFYYHKKDRLPAFVAWEKAFMQKIFRIFHLNN